MVRSDRPGRAPATDAAAAILGRLVERAVDVAVELEAIDPVVEERVERGGAARSDERE